MLGGLSVVPLTTYPGELGYSGLFLWTLRLSWEFWWLLRVDVRNPRGGNLELLLTLHFPILEVTQ